MDMYAIAHEITMKYANITDEEDLINGYIHVVEPKNGDIVYHSNFTGEDSRKYVKIEIASGQYLSNGRVSNFWYWYELDDNNNRISELKHGYGNFFKMNPV